MPHKGPLHTHTPQRFTHAIAWTFALLLHILFLHVATHSDITSTEHRSPSGFAPSHSTKKHPKTRVTLLQRPILKKKTTKKEPQEKTLPKGQIVEIAPNKKQEKPEKADYLSEYNNKVDRQTRSRHASAFYKNVMQEVSTPNKGPTPQEQPTEAHTTPSEGLQTPSLGEGQRFKIAKSKNIDHLLLPSSSLYGTYTQNAPKPGISGQDNSFELPKGSDTQDKENSTQQQPWAAPVGLNASLAGGPMNDHLRDIDEGDGTFLNTREFKYAAFFNRFKRDVAQKWTPWLEYSRRDPTGNIYGRKNRFTVVWITLGPDGALQRTRIGQSSGITFLDEEAVGAIQRAAPFPNPPKALRDSVGLVEFPFGFTVEFDSGF